MLTGAFPYLKELMPKESGYGLDMNNQEDVANHKDTTPIVQGPLMKDEEQAQPSKVSLAAMAKKNHERIRSV